MGIFGKILGKRVKNSLHDNITINAGFPNYRSFFATADVNRFDTVFYNLRSALITNTYTSLSYLYTTNGIVRTFIDAPVDDAFSRNIEYVIPELDNEQLKAVEEWMRAHKVINTLKDAFKWNRLYGGAGIIIDTQVGRESTPLKLSRITPESRIRFIDVSMWELFNGAQNYSQLPSGMDAQLDVFPDDYFDYHGLKIHRSRIVLLKGKPAPDFIRSQLRGWGLSEIESVVSAINQYLKAKDANFEIIDECKLDVYKINSLNYSLMNPEGLNAIQQRFTQMNSWKNYDNAILLDKEDDFEQKTLEFSGLATLMKELRIQLCSELGIPELRLFGTSSEGNALAKKEFSQENYFNMIYSTVQEPAKDILITCLQIACQNLFGAIPDEIDVKFPSLESITAQGESDLKTSELERILAAAQAGLISPKEAREMINKQNILPSEIDDSSDELYNKEEIPEEDIESTVKKIRKGDKEGREE